MSANHEKSQLLDSYLFETSQLLEQLEMLLLESEKDHSTSKSMINETFRIMHTIKGNSAMMEFDNISSLAHSVEDLFNVLRDSKQIEINFEVLSDLLFKSIDFIKNSLEKYSKGKKSVESPKPIKDSISRLLLDIDSKSLHTKEVPTNNNIINAPNRTKDMDKNVFKSTIFFEKDCEMENIRAFGVVHNLKNITDDFYYIPEDILDDKSIDVIRENGFTIVLNTDKNYDEIYNFFQETVFLKDLELISLKSNESSDDQECIQDDNKNDNTMANNNLQIVKQSIVSVNINKLDKIMDLVGELVIHEAMVTENPELEELKIKSFLKAARQLKKITTDLQDAVLSVRMVPLATTFHRMHRIVHDMSKNLKKDVQLELIGENTEVDKNVIDNIADPLMHLIRNSIDHGIETPDERKEKGKNEPAIVTLEAKNAGGEVLILVRDNGRGLDKEKILAKAKMNGLLNKPETQMSEQEIFDLILIPGFSTKENISEYSGRGVGMDVVIENVGAIGGKILIESIPNEGTTFTIKIPLTLAIINGMNLKVGNSIYTIPTNTVKKTFVAKDKDIINDPDGNEMIIFRDKCYPVLRLNELYGIKSAIRDISDGIIIMVENEKKEICLFVDKLIGQQQVVVKSLPKYIKCIKKIQGVVGCTLLGNGNISLILDTAGLTA